MVKPDAEMFALVCDRYGLEPGAVLFTDDSLGNVEGARAAGLTTPSRPETTIPSNRWRKGKRASAIGKVSAEKFVRPTARTPASRMSSSSCTAASSAGPSISAQRSRYAAISSAHSGCRADSSATPSSKGLPRSSSWFQAMVAISAKKYSRRCGSGMTCRYSSSRSHCIMTLPRSNTTALTADVAMNRISGRRCRTRDPTSDPTARRHTYGSAAAAVRTAAP
ncbi:MAG: HAD-IA family hydrolase [Actinomycetota bacterium]|nr:HAD-IA family hydrolase [Actinomycetota bacterium]